MNNTDDNSHFIDITEEVLRNNGVLYKEEYNDPVIIKDCKIPKLDISESTFKNGLVISNVEVSKIIIDDIFEKISLNDSTVGDISLYNHFLSSVDFSAQNCNINCTSISVSGDCYLDLEGSIMKSLIGCSCKELYLSGGVIKETNFEFETSLPKKLAQMFLNPDVNVKFTIGEGEECDTSCPETISNIDNKKLGKKIYDYIDIIAAQQRFDVLNIAAFKSDIDSRKLEILHNLIAPFDLGMVIKLRHKEDNSQIEGESSCSTLEGYVADSSVANSPSEGSVTESSLGGEQTNEPIKDPMFYEVPPAANTLYNNSLGYISSSSSNSSSDGSWENSYCSNNEHENNVGRY